MVRSKCKECEYKCRKCDEIARHHASDQIPANATLCWCCENAVPKKDKDGKYTAGCAWSIKRQPVPGWEVSQIVNRYNDDGTIERSYCVTRCPKFVRG